MTFRLSPIDPTKVRENADEKILQSKLFIVTEGKETEIQYFNAFISLYMPSLLSDFILLDRIDATRSHPSYITKQIDKLLKISKTLDEKATKIFLTCKNELDSHEPENNMSMQKIVKKIKKALKDDEKFEELFGNSKDSHLNFRDSLEVVLNLKQFAKDIDEVLIVIDRDRQSFKPQQYDDVVKIARENNYHLGVTNPCFELFLFLHFSNIENLSHEDIVKNKKISKNQRYMEKALKEELKKCGKSYAKNKFDSNFIVQNFQNVENNLIQSNLDTDVQKLKDNIGSSLNEVLKQYI